ncbi:hypothetical protein F4859DRAFT_354896 [Xylaria cf. heliscus]|nr:hypothetical protein F4859DRAFT_354896 [Xylaria cf. heliscus]
MLGLLKAAVLLAPALELVWAAAPEAVPVSNDKDITSSSLITLAWNGNSINSALQQTTLDLRVFESTTPCGYGNVTLNGEPLDQDDSGLGSGPIPTDSGSVLVADWKFTCVHLEQDSQVQLLSVHIVSVDDQEVDDVAFSVQFQQVAPVSISYIDGTTATSKSLAAPDSSENQRPSLEDELAELEMLKDQLFALEHAIALKITHISDSFNLDQPERLLQAADCGGLRCFFGTVYDRMKAMANRLYHGGQGERSSASRLGSPYWSSSYRGQRPLMDIDRVAKPSSIPSPQGLGSVSSYDATKDSISIADKDADRPNQPQQPFIDEPHRVLHILVLVIVVLAVIINLIVMILIFQCVRLLRQRRQARWEKRRDRLRRSREHCNTLVATKYMDLIQWLRDGLRREGVEDQEKHAMMRQLHESDLDEETMSTTMEEEIAQFRAAASAVGNLVSTEGERGRSRLSEHLSLIRPRRGSTPLSIMSSCPTYRSVDESLPAYDENCSPEYVVDGFQHTPDGSTSGSSSPRSSTFGGSTTRSSLDENVEKERVKYLP